MLFDTHAHLQNELLEDQFEQIMERARQAGVEKIACVGYDLPSSQQALKLAQKHEEICAVAGVHPHDAKDLDESSLAELYQLARDPQVVAIGEIGLDYYRDLSPRDLQQKAFIAQIKLAREVGKPIVIHDRDAHQDVFDIIKQEGGGKDGGIMHCYSGNLPLAIEFMKRGFYISFAGPLTFKNSRRAQEVASKISLDRILVETDCPYLTPEPYRGKTNEPAYVRYVADKLAELRGRNKDEMAFMTYRNACEAYRIKM